MKRVAFEKLEQEKEDYARLREKWIKHVLDCQHDAEDELGKIYKELTGEKRINHFKLTLEKRYQREGSILTSVNRDKFYLFFIDSVICFGAQAEEYPIDDKSLWPWAAVNRPKPQFSKDIWQCIICLLSPADRLCLALANKELYAMVHHERFWQKERVVLYSQIVVARSFLDANPTWMFYSKLFLLAARRRKCSNPCKTPEENILLLNLQLPFGDKVAIPENFFSKEEGGRTQCQIIAENMTFGWRKHPRCQKVKLLFNGFELEKSYHVTSLFISVVVKLLEGDLDTKKYSAFRKWRSLAHLMKE